MNENKRIIGKKLENRKEETRTKGRKENEITKMLIKFLLDLTHKVSMTHPATSFCAALLHVLFVVTECGLAHSRRML